MSTHPSINDRRTGPDGLLLEWTGYIWAQVCPDCDVPNATQQATCGTCGLRAGDWK